MCTYVRTGFVSYAACVGSRAALARAQMHSVAPEGAILQQHQICFRQHTLVLEIRCVFELLHDFRRNAAALRCRWRRSRGAHLRALGTGSAGDAAATLQVNAGAAMPTRVGLDPVFLCVDMGQETDDVGKTGARKKRLRQEELPTNKYVATTLDQPACQCVLLI